MSWYLYGETGGRNGVLEEEEVKGLWRVWWRHGNDLMDSSVRKWEMGQVSTEQSEEVMTKSRMWCLLWVGKLTNWCYWSVLILHFVHMLSLPFFAFLLFLTPKWHMTVCYPFPALLQDFVVSRSWIKLFQTGNIDLVNCCQSYFCFELPSAIHYRRARKFELRYRNHSNLFCQMISYLWILLYGTIVSLFTHCRCSLRMI